MAYELDPNLERYADSPEQWEKYLVYCKYGGKEKAEKNSRFSGSAIMRAKQSILRKAAKYGYSPDHDMTHEAPEGFGVKGVSTLYGPDGELKAQWVKTDRDREAQEMLMRQAVEAMAADLPTLKPRKKTPDTNGDILSVIPMGDPHFGMYSWADETGEDFDLDIARRDLCAAVDYLVSQSPASEKCVIINLGDFFHVDNLKNMTSQSGNVLDVDTRLPKMVQVGVSALRQSIESALDRHKLVEIINVVGNHDGVLAMALSVMLANVYEKEPRVIVRDEPTPRHYVEHGKCLIGTTHGDRTKDRDLPGIMATEMPEAWGRTKHRYFYRGHHHHDTLEMFNGCTVEQFSTLAPTDAYHNSKGYLSGRNMKLIALHKEYGEVGRSVCSIEMLRGLTSSAHVTPEMVS